MSLTIQENGKRLIARSSLENRDIRNFCATLHRIIMKKGYKDVILDFSEAFPVRESFILPILPIIYNYRFDGIDFDLILPTDQRAKNLFHNANWAHLLDDRNYGESTYDVLEHVPAIRFTNADEQNNAVDRIMEVILSSLSLNREHLKALEWSLTEISDNVLNHSESRSGGFVQATTLKHRNAVEFIVADGGIGIPKSLNINRHGKALKRAIEQGVTRNKETNQGNGLFGSYQVSVISKGEFEISSMNATLLASKGDDIRTLDSKIPYKGTYVRCIIDCNEQGLLEKALVFGGKKHDPAFDFIEKKFESEHSEDLTISIKEHRNLLGSREFGSTLRNKISNLLRAAGSGTKLQIDFSDVFVISSSVADEAFGKLFAQIGPLEFMQRIEIVNVDPTVKMLIDRAISQRMQI